MKKILVIFSLLFLMACDDNPKRRELLADEANVMTDSKGNYWVVRHHIGGTYTISYLGDSTTFKK